MIIASAADVGAAVAIDPTALALLGIFGGAALTAIAGWIGAGIQARREHTKWLRERRYETYIEFLRAVRAFQQVQNDSKNIVSPVDRANAKNLPSTEHLLTLLNAALQGEQVDLVELTVGAQRRSNHNQTLTTKLEQYFDRLRNVVRLLHDAIAAFEVLGPSEAATAANDLLTAMKNAEGFDQSQRRAIAAMRRALGIQKRRVRMKHR